MRGKGGGGIFENPKELTFQFMLLLLLLLLGVAGRLSKNAGSIWRIRNELIDSKYVKKISKSNERVPLSGFKWRRDAGVSLPTSKAPIVAPSDVRDRPDNNNSNNRNCDKQNVFIFTRFFGYSLADQQQQQWTQQQQHSKNQRFRFEGFFGCSPRIQQLKQQQQQQQTLGFF